MTKGVFSHSLLLFMGWKIKKKRNKVKAWLGTDFLNVNCDVEYREHFDELVQRPK